MEIYVVKHGDTIYSIAQQYGISVNRLIHENGLPNPYNLVQGQALVITFPSQEHVVKEGDTLSDIAQTYGVSMMQLLRNNSFLTNREFIYPNETLVVSYNTSGSMVTNGYAYDFISHDTLYETLPYLTYLSIFNYRLGEEGSIIKYGDDAELIQAAKSYDVIPLFMVSSLSPLGEPNIELIYEFLLNEAYQETYNKNLITIVKSSGYNGVNVLVSGINSTNQTLYMNAWSKISKLLKDNGLLFFLTINPNIKSANGNLSFEPIDYSPVSNLVDGFIFLPYTWATNPENPGPIISLPHFHSFADEVLKTIPADKILLGMPLLGYDWVTSEAIQSQALSLTINSCIILALNTGSIIQFDEASQTPYFTYETTVGGRRYEHIVWFIDARSIKALNDIVLQKKLSGSGIWNIMIFYQPLWSLITSQYDIIKSCPVNSP